MLLNKYPVSFFVGKFKEEENVRVRGRLQMLLYLREGKTYRIVAQLLKTSIGIITYWRQRFEEEGVEGLHDKQGRGKKPMLRKTDLSAIEKMVDGGVKMPDGYTRGCKTKDVRSFIQEQFKVAYTPRHCRRLLHKLRYRLKVPRPKNKSRNKRKVSAFKRAFKKNALIWVKKSQ